MSKNRFEQLIEYVINDEESKARELFHQIVVEKSRAIYEDLMDEEVEEEGVEESVEESIDEDDAMGRMDQYDEALGGDAAADLIDDVETEECGMATEDDDMSDEETVDGEPADLEDRVVKLEDELDNLMAEFEAMISGDDTGDEEMVDVAADDAMDTPDMTGLEVADDELETEGLEEAISLKAAPKPCTSEEGSINKKSAVAANSGARGAVASPVKMTGDTAQGRSAPTTKELIGKVGNSPAGSTQTPKPAAKPHLAQATGVNTKTPFPGR